MIEWEEWLDEGLAKVASKYSTSREVGLRLAALSKFNAFIATITPGGPIVSASDNLSDSFRLSNRVVSFVLDQKTHYGTGVLVGPRHVLTAAHLFFDEDGELIDESRFRRTTAVVNTVHLGDTPAMTQFSTKLYGPDATEALVDPCFDGTIPRRREVVKLDFAIVRVYDTLGTDPVGNGETRGWVELPTARQAPIITTEMAVRAFQYIDAKEPRLSSGFVRGFSASGDRVLHTASTIDGSSGSPVIDQKNELIGVHGGGSVSGEFPRSNRALPVGLIAEAIDTPYNGVTVRSLLK